VKKKMAMGGGIGERNNGGEKRKNMAAVMA
jgi:hypothetical protein